MTLNRDPTSVSSTIPGSFVTSPTKHDDEALQSWVDTGEFNVTTLPASLAEITSQAFKVA